LAIVEAQNKKMEDKL